VCSITEGILTDASGAVNRATRQKCWKNGVLGLAALACAAALAAGCGAARHPPRPYPGAAPAVADATATSEPAVEPVVVGAPGEAAANLALSLQGAPYADGGTDTDGFDCSGFVQYVFARADLALPRSVREQFETGQAVEGAPRAGDLVFFAIDGSRVSHVGIATGPDTFVHAPSSRGVVRVDRLSAPYWSRRYAGARRIR
jgi:cell wall-associated NlpC family hydrolase